MTFKEAWNKFFIMYASESGILFGRPAEDIKKILERFYSILKEEE